MPLPTAVPDRTESAAGHDLLRPPRQMRIAGVDILLVRSRIVWLFLLTWPPLLDPFVPLAFAVISPIDVVKGLLKILL